MSATTKYVPAGRNTSNPADSNPPHRRSRFDCSDARNGPVISSPIASAVATPYCRGPPDTYVRNCFTVRTASTSSTGPVTQPTFQPVNENDLPADEIVSVR